MALAPLASRSGLDKTVPIPLAPQFTTCKSTLAQIFLVRACSIRGSITGPTWVDDVLHNVVIEVDEEGTVAAAATAVATTKGRSPPVTPVLINRPFGFGVFDLKSRETLFVASVVHPGMTGI